MSGIVGIVNLDGAPIDKELLERMTAFMVFRGPDARNTWTKGQVGFGHTLFRTTFEAEYEQQPGGMEDSVWITADARIDGRADLISKLRGHGRNIHDPITDPELILHAYLVWDDNCIEHLIGDFAFAIWDARNQRLFCARDHFGAKPFYYAKLENILILSNTLNCLRRHPDISDELNDLAIADFLMFGFNQEPNSTSFTDIQRLPPAHLLTLSKGTLRTRQYWTLPTDRNIRYKHDHEYTDHFREIFTTAIHDRLRTDSATILMSGGLDSTSIAATAHNLSSSDCRPTKIYAETTVYDHLIPDPERQFAESVSQALAIQHDCFVADGYRLFDRCGTPELTFPEPVDQSLGALSNDFTKQTATQSRVALDGQGGDEVLFRECLVNLVGTMPLLEILGDLMNTLFVHHLRPAFCIRGQISQWLQKEHVGIEGFPEWLNKDLVRNLDLKGRYRHYLSHHRLSDLAGPNQSRRPSAIKRLNSNKWGTYLESYDPGVTGATLEVRWPFVDIRLVTDLLGFPPIPWFIDKTLLRNAMEGELPESVRLRPKTPMLGDPVVENLRNEDYDWIDNFKATSKLGNYVIRDAIPKVVARPVTPSDYYRHLRPLSLNLWLKNYTQTLD